MKKRTLSVLLAAALMASLTGCGGSGQSSTTTDSSAKTEVSLFITEVPPPTIPPSRIDCCLTVRFFCLPSSLRAGQVL